MTERHSAFETIGRGWKIIACAAAVSCVSAMAISLLVPATFTAEARMLVSAPDASLEATIPGQPVRTEAPGAWVLTQAELLRWRAFRVEVIDRLKLKTTPEELAEDITVWRVDESQVVAIRARADDPKTAADVANTLAAVYTTRTRDSRARTLRETAEALSREIDAANEEVAAIDAASGALSREQATQRTVASARLARLSQQLEQVRLAQELLQSWAVLTDAAVPPPRRTGPAPIEAALIGAIAGFLLGAVVVLSKDAAGPPPAEPAHPAPAPAKPASLDDERARRVRRGA